MEVCLRQAKYFDFLARSASELGQITFTLSQIRLLSLLGQIKLPALLDQVRLLSLLVKSVSDLDQDVLPLLQV